MRREEAPGKRLLGGRSSKQMYESLRRFYAESPACLKAARPIKEGSCSLVTLEGDEEPYTLIREKGVSVLKPGKPVDPDMYFGFTAGAIEALTSSHAKTVGDYATRIFDLILSDDPTRKVDYKLFASFPKLVRRGYVGVLALGGRAVLAYGARHGVRGLADLRRLIASVMSGSSEAVIGELKKGKTPGEAKGARR